MKRKIALFTVSNKLVSFHKLLPERYRQLQRATSRILYLTAVAAKTDRAGLIGMHLLHTQTEWWNFRWQVEVALESTCFQKRTQRQTVAITFREDISVCFKIATRTHNYALPKTFDFIIIDCRVALLRSETKQEAKKNHDTATEGNERRQLHKCYRLLVMRLIYGFATRFGLGENISEALNGAFVPPGVEEDYGFDLLDRDEYDY
ncbi:hypothetical protein FQA39_LY15847 [Lamprigera yunnana]|nr:hypothetical protein FQA39_LY15847 [Lamprigera yunnana]